MNLRIVGHAALERTGGFCYIGAVRRLGIDPGERRVGLALAEPGLAVATALRTVERAAGYAFIAEIAAEVKAREVDQIVIGLPLRLDGSEGESARRVREIGVRIEAATGKPVVYWDERLSTRSATRALSSQGVRGAAQRKVIDQAAAALLLQSYLDANTEHSWLNDHEAEDPHPPPDPASGRRAPRGRSAPRRR